MRSGRVAMLLLLVAALAGGAVWWTGRTPDMDPGDVPSEAEATEDAPVEEQAPALSSAPPRPPSAKAAAAASAVAEEPVVDAPRVPGGPLTIRIELPSPPDPALASLPLRLRLVARDAEVVDRVQLPDAAPDAAFQGEPAVEWLRPIDPMAREPAPAWRIGGLSAGEWVVHAVPTSPSPDDPLRSWGPVLVRLGSEPHDVTLPLARDTTHGRLRLRATRGGKSIQAAFDLTWRHCSLGVLAALDGEHGREVRVPADEDVFVTAAPDVAPRAGPITPRFVRVAAGAVEEVLFEFPELVGVTLAVLRPGREPATGHTLTLWRTRDPTGGAPTKVLQWDWQTQGKEQGSAPSLDLSPGDYGLLVTRVTPYLPLWHLFRVGPEEPTTVEILLERTGPEAVCLLQRADGSPADGVGLWLGRLDGPSPGDTVTVMATSGPDGRINFGPLPDGEYLVAEYGASNWRTVRVESGLMDPAILKLPAAPPEGSPRARLRGRVRAPSGGPLRQGLVCVGLEDDWRRYAHFSGGQFDIEAPAGEWVLTVHHTWFEPDLFAPWSRPVVVEAGKDQTFEVRLRAR
jgi:hypothetical protein